MRLSETWFIEGYIDFELQKYRLLAYLKEVNHFFNETKLYPLFSDVIFHYNNLISFRDSKKLLQDNFPKRLDQVNLKKLELTYEQMLADNEIMQELENITTFALEQMKGTIESGAELYDFIEQKTYIQPIGILPLYKDDGYMLLRFGKYSEIRAYSYNISLFEDHNAKYKGLKVQYLDTWPKSISNTYGNIKREIIRTFRTLPNPAVYSIETELSVPLNETFLPIAKRMLVRKLAAA